MQSETPHIPPRSPADETSLPPSSPPLHPFHRPYAPAGPTYDHPDPLAGLRRRPLAPHAPATRDTDGMVQIEIRDPYADESRRKEAGLPVSSSKRIGELKDEIASGAFHDDGSRWAREGMRLVWQGRIVGDGETVGGALGPASGRVVILANDPIAQVHTFHLVARRIGQPHRPTLSRHETGEPTPTASFSAPAVAATSTSPISGDARTIQALLDCTHYLLFIARHHLCRLTDTPALAWDDVYPKPTLPQPMAREAVMSVLRIFISGSNATAWGTWEDAFVVDGGDTTAVEAAGREATEAEVRSLWESRVGRAWCDGPAGEVVLVEVDGITRDLHLPPLDKLSNDRMGHLLLYLRITSLLPRVSNLLHLESLPAPAPTPTTTASANVTPATPQRRQVNANQLPQIPLPVLNHLFFSALKISAMLWMLLGNMRWSDRRLWIMYGSAFVYWAVDGWRVYQAALPRRGHLGANQPAVPAAGAGAGAVDGQAAGNGVPGGAAARPTGAAAVHDAADPIRRAREYRERNPWVALPLLHLDIDSMQLHVPAFATHVEFQPEIAAQIANDPERADAIRRRAGRVPPWIQTQLLLPIALWVLTLIPEWESLRARAIRKRERAMRVLVGEMTAAARDASPPEADSLPMNAEQDQEQQQSQAPVLPFGLGAAAEKYYRRVLQRGEGIDWQEEREAQRLLGIGEEEEERNGGGMRMGML